MPTNHFTGDDSDAKYTAAAAALDAIRGVTEEFFKRFEVTGTEEQKEATIALKTALKSATGDKDSARAKAAIHFLANNGEDLVEKAKGIKINYTDVGGNQPDIDAALDALVYTGVAGSRAASTQKSAGMSR